MLDNDKLETQKQWNNDPCGANTVTEHIEGTLEFYQAARRFRYNNYGPWFHSIMQFDKYKNLSVLEIGVGLGSDHHSFAKNGNRMTCLDLSKGHLAHTFKHLQLEGLHTDGIYGDAEDMPFTDGTFDVIYSFGVLHHTPNTQKSIDEVYRALKNDGTAIIGLYHRDSIFFWFMTIFWSGVIKGGLITKGWRKLLSEIEFRSNPESAIPLVKVYSRNQVKQLFKAFKSVELKVCHVEDDHFGKLSFMAKKISRAQLEKKLGWAGWYIVAKATK